MRQFIQIPVTPFERQQIKRIARENNRTVADFIREAVNEAAADCHDGSAILKLRKKES